MTIHYRDCLFCHKSLTSKSSDLIGFPNGSVTTFKCNVCDVNYNTIFGVSCTALNYYKHGILYQIQIYNWKDNWNTNFYVGSDKEPSLRFNQLFWIFPSNMEYWIGRFLKVLSIS